MRIRSIQYDDRETLEEINVMLTPVEAALIVRLVGGIRGTDLVAVAGNIEYVDACSSVYDRLTGVFNCEYEHGVDEISRYFDIDTIVDHKRARQQAVPSTSDGG